MKKIKKVFKRIVNLLNVFISFDIKKIYRELLFFADDVSYFISRGKIVKLWYPPRYVTLMLSGFCSQRCVFCCHHSEDAKYGKFKHLYKLGYNMPFEIFKELVDKCYDARVPHIHICGNGEPTIHPDFLKCLDYVIEKYGHVSFQSNFDERIYRSKKLVKEIQQRSKYIDYITMDLVGYNAETHNPLKIGSDFDSVLNLMSEINSKSPGIKFYAHWILTKQSYKGIDELLFELRRKKINFKLDIVNLHAYEFNKFCALSSRYLKEYDYITKELDRVKRLADENSFEVTFPQPIDEKTSKCEAFWSRLQIGFSSHDLPRSEWHGNCLPMGGCDAVVKGSLRSYGNLLKTNSLWGVWNNKLMMNARKDMIKGKYPDEACKHCQNYV